MTTTTITRSPATRSRVALSWITMLVSQCAVAGDVLCAGKMKLSEVNPRKVRYSMTRFVTREQAAEMLACKSSYLANLKNKRRGPRVYKWGTADRSPCRYDVADVIEWAKDPAGHERRVWGAKGSDKQNQRRARRK